MSFIYQVAF